MLSFPSAQVEASHKIEIPASMAHRLTAEQTALLETHAAAHGDSRHHLATVEKVRLETNVEVSTSILPTAP